MIKPSSFTESFQNMETHLRIGWSVSRKKKEATRVEIACSLSRTQSFAGGFKNQWRRVRLCLCEREMVCVGAMQNKEARESRGEQTLIASATWLIGLNYSANAFFFLHTPSCGSLYHTLSLFSFSLSFSYPKSQFTIDTNQNAMTWINGERL